MGKLRRTFSLTALIVATVAVTSSDALARVIVKDKTRYESGDIGIDQGGISLSLEIQNNKISGVKNHVLFVSGTNSNTGATVFISCEVRPNAFTFNDKGAHFSINSATLVSSDVCFIQGDIAIKIDWVRDRNNSDRFLGTRITVQTTPDGIRTVRNTISNSISYSAEASVSLSSTVLGNITGVIGGPDATLGSQASVEEGTSTHKEITVTKNGVVKY